MSFPSERFFFTFDFKQNLIKNFNKFNNFIYFPYFIRSDGTFISTVMQVLVEVFIINFLSLMTMPMIIIIIVTILVKAMLPQNIG